MGQLLYGDSLPFIDFDDRALAHLKVGIFTKFRRHESFAFSWDHGTANGSEHSSMWLTAEIPVRFVFTERQTPGTEPGMGGGPHSRSELLVAVRLPATATLRWAIVRGDGQTRS
ncbi:DUF7882 family protein [Glaciihabitans sp. GrIS 2.15]|uniref:DUF7882 family protein n=1 Tax=Glaciihabitans sp. GrIS 2.15 TaxID=3071710 RepID=UPI002E09D806|nr:hypothetical protein [Glaciihabitans sp. GrIS 2.15]